MRNYVLATALAVGNLLAITSPAFAQVELKNDGYVDGAMVGFQGGFVIGEIGASRFSPPSAGAQLLSVQFLFGGGVEGSTKDITLHVWDDSGLGDNPGAALFSGDFTVTDTTMALQEVDLSGNNVFPPGPFRVGVEFKHNGAPGIASDADGSIAADKNYILAQGLGWVRSNSLGLTGDWIIRAYVTDNGSGGSSSSSSSSSSGAGGSGMGGNSGMQCLSNQECPPYQYCSPLGACTFDCRADPDCGSGSKCNSLGQCVAGDGEESGGCGCRVASSEGAGISGVLLGLAALAMKRRRVGYRRPRQ